jgi:hypothetical protein
VFLRNLNLFFPYFSLLSSLLGSLLATFVYLLAVKFFPSIANPKLIPYVPHALIFITLIMIWRVKGLSPSSIVPLREKTFKRGHVLVALANLISLGFALFSSLVAIQYGTFGNLAFYLPLISLGVLIMWLTGLMFIWSSWRND